MKRIIIALFVGLLALPMVASAHEVEGEKENKTHCHYENPVTKEKAVAAHSFSNPVSVLRQGNVEYYCRNGVWGTGSAATAGSFLASLVGGVIIYIFFVAPLFTY